MSLDTIVLHAKSLWVVWMMALFIGIVAWAFWPSRKQTFEAHGHIPLDDDDDEEG